MQHAAGIQCKSTQAVCVKQLLHHRWGVCSSVSGSPRLADTSSCSINCIRLEFLTLVDCETLSDECTASSSQEQQQGVHLVRSLYRVLTSCDRAHCKNM